MKLLTISDIHWNFTQKELQLLRNNDNYNVCLCLGDIQPKDLQTIREYIPKDIPILAIEGNHDTKEAIKHLNIEGVIALDGIRYEVAGIGFVGLSGTERYKSGDFAMMTQKEILTKAKELPQGDILVSHEGPYRFWNKEKDGVHDGLRGISWYITHKHPLVVIHGHYHMNKIKKFGGIFNFDCQVICTNRVKKIEINI